MKHHYQVIEDNGGGLYFFVFDQKDSCIYAGSSFEYQEQGSLLSCMEAIEQGETPETWEGEENPQAFYDELTGNEFGWEIVATGRQGIRTTYPERMGMSAEKEIK